MAGLLDQRPQRAPAQQGAPLPDEGEEVGEGVTEDEQRSYNEFVTNGMTLIYDEKAMPGLLEAMGGDGNPVEGLANAAVTIVTRLDDSARQAGQEISGDVKMHGAVELIEQLAELAQEGGVHEYSEEEMESALYMAMDIYRDAAKAKGTLPTEELKQDFGALMAADQQGALDQMVPGLSEFARQRAPKAGGPPQQGGKGGPGRRPA